MSREVSLRYLRSSSVIYVSKQDRHIAKRKYNPRDFVFRNVGYT